jgi:hypothetical protein
MAEVTRRVTGRVLRLGALATLGTCLTAASARAAGTTRHCY